MRVQAEWFWSDLLVGVQLQHGRLGDQRWWMLVLGFGPFSIWFESH